MTAACFAECDVQTIYINTSFNPNIIQIENAFKSVLAPNSHIVAYTKVPRGLIVSVAESVLFNKGDYRVKESGFALLDVIAGVLSQFDNRCVVESHTDEAISPQAQYSADWEISIMRANEITDYVVKKGKIKRGRIFPLGFGEIMPFKENVSKSGFQDSRVDFVIIDYELKR